MRRFVKEVMVLAIENQAFSLVILIILKKRAKRLAVFDGINIFPSEKNDEISRGASDAIFWRSVINTTSKFEVWQRNTGERP